MEKRKEGMKDLIVIYFTVNVTILQSTRIGNEIFNAF